MKEKALTLDRLKTALQQNPQFKIIYEFRDQAAADDATSFILREGFNDIVEVRVRQDP